MYMVVCNHQRNTITTVTDGRNGDEMADLYMGMYKMDVDWERSYINGGVMLCPRRISVDFRSRYANCTKMCSDCRREFWMQEVE